MRIASGESEPSEVLSSERLLEAAQEHLTTVPTGLEAHEPSVLEPIGKWIVRNGQMIEFEGRPGPLPEDERLVVVTTYTAIRNAGSVTIDTQVALYEIVVES